MSRSRKVDAKALAKKLIERQLTLFNKTPDAKLMPSELSWLLDVFKTMAEAESKDQARPLEKVNAESLLKAVGGHEED